MAKYVALLRGINVGGNKKVPMAQLKKVFESNGFTNAKTLLNTGNVVFDGKGVSPGKLSEILEEEFGFSIPVILVDFEDVVKIVKADPFKGVKVTKDTRLYVTFLGDGTKAKLKIPYSSPDGSFKIIGFNGLAVYGVLDLAKGRTVDGMAILEKEFGKNITTRNYNTVKKIADL